MINPINPGINILTKNPLIDITKAISDCTPNFDNKNIKAPSLIPKPPIDIGKIFDITTDIMLININS